MERQNEPATKKKSWSEMTEEEQQDIRESWKHTLPEEYDVYCIGDFVCNEDFLIIPGDFYVSGHVHTKDLSIKGNFWADGNVYTNDLRVLSNFFALSSIHAVGFIVHGNCIANCDVHSSGTIIHGDFIVRYNIISHSVHTYGILDCLNVICEDSHIRANDFVCRCYEEVKQ